MLAEVAYSSVIANGLLREPVFKALRDDLDDSPEPRNRLALNARKN